MSATTLIVLLVLLLTLLGSAVLLFITVKYYWGERGAPPATGEARRKQKEEELRLRRSLIQTIGRAARNAGGKAILYADKITDSMKHAIDETARRREIQERYNEEHGITPTTIVKPVEATLVTAYEADYFKVPLDLDAFEEYSPKQLKETIAQMEVDMRAAAKDMKFERAAEIRDRLKYLRERELEYR